MNGNFQDGGTSALIGVYSKILCNHPGGPSNPLGMEERAWGEGQRRIPGGFGTSVTSSNTN